MARYRIFKRTWWLDKAHTRPGAGRKRYTGQTAMTAAEARDICHRNNLEDYGDINGRGPLGQCSEFES